MEDIARANLLAMESDKLDGLPVNAGSGRAVSVRDLAGRSIRAYGAHLNALETFPWFAAAVIVAHMVGGPGRIADGLAVVYVLLRIGHMAAYIAGRQPLRSAAFGLAQLCAVAIFVSPLFR